MTNKKRIVWDESDRHAIAGETARILYDDPLLTCLKAANKAVMLKMPAYKQKDITSLQSVPWLKSEVYKVLDYIKTHKADRLESDLEEVINLNEEYVKRLERLEQRLNTVDPQAAIEVVAESMSINDIAINIGRSIMDKMIEQQLEAQQMMTMTPVCKRKTRKLRVAVAGLLKGQAKLVDAKFNNAFDFRFWHSTDSIATLKSNLNQVDHVVVLTRFSSHAVTDVTSQHNHILVSGGLTKLGETLTELSK